MNVLILSPRLDVTFKQGPVPVERGPIPAIRTYWQRMVLHLAKMNQDAGHTVTVLELPLWQFTPELVNSMNPDKVYVPHRERHSFKVKSNIEIQYYMQTVFPWRFYVNEDGYAAGASFYPAMAQLTEVGDENGKDFDLLRIRATQHGDSKFPQPLKGSFNASDLGEYLFFACQIPHDHTILYHSDVSVEDALANTCEIAGMMGLRVAVKGHPVNPGSMQGLKSICAKYKNSVWFDDVSIHDLIPKSRAVVVVNSGVGMESLLYLKPVITFGRAEYDFLTFKAHQDGFDKMINSPPTIDETRVRKFFDVWTKITFDTSTAI